jgi:hypothetical protein
MCDQRVKRKQWQHGWTPVDDIYRLDLDLERLACRLTACVSAETSSYRRAQLKKLRFLRFNLAVRSAAS